MAFFFLKPGSVNAKVDALVEKIFREHNITVLDQGIIDGPDTADVIDLHYGVLAERARHVAANNLPPVPESAVEAFESTFGVRWAEAIETGAVLNLSEAIEAGVFPDGASAKEKEAEWRASPCVKLFSGTYVAKVGDHFVINGFYEAMRQMFVQAPNGVSWKVVGWDSSRGLSWNDFRVNIVGATNPTKASPTSIRGHLFSSFATYGMTKPPAGAANGCHASASPLEALFERGIWLGGATGGAKPTKINYPQRHTPLLSILRDSGATDADVLWLCRNPTCPGDDTPVFDLVEHTTTKECAAILLQKLRQRNQ